MTRKQIVLPLNAALVFFLAAPMASYGNPEEENKPAATTSGQAENQQEKEKEDDRLFDNTTMARVLEKAERLCEQSDFVSAKKEWTRVINFMHKPRWFPTAAMVPVSLRFAKLADFCMKNNQIDDAHQLMHAAFEFPFQIAKDEVEIDAIAARLVSNDKKAGNLDKCKSFLRYAVEKSAEPRRTTYQKWLDSLE